MPLAAVLKNLYFSKFVCVFIKIRRDIAREMTMQIIVENWFYTEIALVISGENWSKTVKPLCIERNRVPNMCEHVTIFRFLGVIQGTIRIFVQSTTHKSCSLFTDIAYFCANFVFSTDYVIKNVRRILILIENAVFVKPVLSISRSRRTLRFVTFSSH